ncbi:uncharacterized protein LOC116615510 [Nematostella vectensis]|uniref:uncharacterized protein LOC116615510 n=1 Tax=Nematostella vectensis TaxID=45351 RepID=UPI00139060DB|nr:uncharacterized protein LOC116615510 [Nematostella vectensis]
MWVLLALLVAVCACAAEPIVKPDCSDVYQSYDLSKNFNETIAHAIHSMTVQGLRLFNPRANPDNRVPTVNHDIKDAKHLVLPYAPDSPTGEDFSTDTMNIIDSVLSRIGKDDDGLGPNWSAVERVVHTFHMIDVWKTIKGVYDDTVALHPPQNFLCECLLDTHSNGIYRAVHWVAEHYKSGTPITLLNRPIPKLRDAKSWRVWKSRLLHYYKRPALYDASLFLYCATKDF